MGQLVCRYAEGGGGWSEEALVWLRTARGVDLSVLQGSGGGGGDGK